MKSRFSLRKAERLRRGDDFRRAFSQGESFGDNYFFFYVLKHLPNTSSPLKKVSDAPVRIVDGGVGMGNRVGFVVSKRVGKAVTRNRVRRLLRESYRQNKGKLKEGRDLVLVAKKRAVELSFSDMQDALLRLFSKAGLLKEQS